MQRAKPIEFSGVPEFQNAIRELAAGRQQSFSRTVRALIASGAEQHAAACPRIEDREALGRLLHVMRTTYADELNTRTGENIDAEVATPN